MRRLPMILVVLLTLGWAGIISWFTLAEYHKLNLHRFDLGNVEQTVYRLSHGLGFTLTDPYGTEVVSRVAFHADFFLFLLVPFYWLAPYAETLIVTHVILSAISIPGVFFFVNKRWMSAWHALLVALAVAVSAPFVWSAIIPLHAVTFVLPALVWAAVLFDRHQLKWTLVLIAAATLMKEEIGFGVGIAAFLVWLRSSEAKTRTFAAWTAPLAVAYASAMVFLVVPAYAQPAAGTTYRSAFGKESTQIVTNIMQHPVAAVRQLLARDNLTYTAKLLVSSGGVSLISPLSLAAVPDFVINGLSDKIQQRHLRFHYHGGIWPWMLVGAIVWWASILQRVDPRRRSRFRLLGAGTILAGALVVAYTDGPYPGTPNDWLRYATWRNEYAAPVRAITSQIPSVVPVTATNNVGAQLSGRERLLTFPLGTAVSDVAVVLQHRGPVVVASDDAVAQALESLKRDPNWRMAYARGELTVLQRVGTSWSLDTSSL